MASQEEAFLNTLNNGSLKELKDSLSIHEKDAYEKTLQNMRTGKTVGTVLSDIHRIDVIETPKERKDYTIKVTFPASGKPYFREDVSASFMEGLEPFDIGAVGPLEDNSKWLLTLRSKEAVVRALSTTPKIGDNVGRVFSLTKNIVTCRIHWLPIYVPMAATVVFMSRYGVVHSANWDYSKIKDFAHVRSIVRNIVLELSDGVSIPSIDRLMYDKEVHRFLITIRGRGPVCFHCQATGHTRQNCSAPYCRHCASFNHSTEECSVKNTYAGRTSQQQEVGDDPEQAKSQPTTPSTNEGQSSTSDTPAMDAQDSTSTDDTKTNLEWTDIDTQLFGDTSDLDLSGDSDDTVVDASRPGTTKRDAKKAKLR